MIKIKKMKNIFTCLVGLACTASVVSADEIYATFHIEATKSSNLAFDTGGIVKNVFVDKASEVKKGQKLAELNNEELSASLDVAKATIENAEVSLKFAQKDFDRQTAVKNLIDEAQFDKYALALEGAKAKLSEAKANLAYKQTLYKKTVLVAPYDGVIFDKSVDAGDAVSGAALRTIFKMQSKSDRKLILEFDQKYWKNVKVGQTFKFSVDGDGQTKQGQISKIYPYANNTNRKMMAEVKANNFAVGLFGSGYIITNPNSSNK